MKSVEKKRKRSVLPMFLMIFIGLLTVCACLAGAGVMPAFAEVTDFTEYEEWVEAGKTADSAQLAELWQEYYTSPEILEQALACCPENTEENRKAAEEFVIKDTLASEMTLEELCLTAEQKEALLSGEKEFSIISMPCLASDILLCLKKGENISAQDIRSALDGWKFALFLDGKPISNGIVTLEREDTPNRYADYLDGFCVLNMTLNALETAQKQAEIIAAANELGEVYALSQSDVTSCGYVLLSGDQVIFYENEDALLSNTAQKQKMTNTFFKAEYLRLMESCNDRIAAARQETVYSGADGKTAADFYGQAEFILYVRPWVIAGSVVLGLAVIGTIVLVVWKKRKMAKAAQ